MNNSRQVLLSILQANHQTLLSGSTPFKRASGIAGEVVTRKPRRMLHNSRVEVSILPKKLVTMVLLTCFVLMGCVPPSAMK